MAAMSRFGDRVDDPGVAISREIRTVEEHAGVSTARSRSFAAAQPTSKGDVPELAKRRCFE